MIFIIQCDSPALWQTYLPAPASITMEGILIFNKHLFFFVTLIVLFVSWLLVYLIYYFIEDKWFAEKHSNSERLEAISEVIARNSVLENRYNLVLRHNPQLTETILHLCKAATGRFSEIELGHVLAAIDCAVRFKQERNGSQYINQYIGGTLSGIETSNVWLRNHADIRVEEYEDLDNIPDPIGSCYKISHQLAVYKEVNGVWKWTPDHLNHD